jgi:hypothetical protein
MFLFKGNVLQLDTPFTDNEIQYPANWLRLASQEERAAVGIEEVADPIRADDRFYKNGDINLPRALEDETITPEQGDPFIQRGLKYEFINNIKHYANALLSATDWKIIRATETSTYVDSSVLAARAAIREACNQHEQAIIACTNVAELAALNFTWPE